MTKGKSKKMGKQAKREGTVQSVGDFCEESFDGETNINSLIIEIYPPKSKSEIIVGCKNPRLASTDQSTPL